LYPVIFDNIKLVINMHQMSLSLYHGLLLDMITLAAYVGYPW